MVDGFLRQVNTYTYAFCPLHRIRLRQLSLGILARSLYLQYERKAARVGVFQTSASGMAILFILCDDVSD